MGSWAAGKSWNVTVVHGNDHVAARQEWQYEPWPPMHSDFQTRQMERQQRLLPQHAQRPGVGGLQQLEAFVQVQGREVVPGFGGDKDDECVCQALVLVPFGQNLGEVDRGAGFGMAQPRGIDADFHDICLNRVASLAASWRQLAGGRHCGFAGAGCWLHIWPMAVCMACSVGAM